jgi:hypothetical protein
MVEGGGGGAQLSGGQRPLPKYCLRFCLTFFLSAMAICTLKEVAKHRNWWVQHYIHNALDMTVSFFIGSFFLFVDKRSTPLLLKAIKS